jgi:hypothetical protein
MAAVRRLSELLQEQQEPFLVEVAKGRRPRRGRGGSGSGDGSGGGGAGLGCCSGSAAAACRRLLRLCNHGFKKRKSGVAGVGSGLRSALSKVLCSRAMRWVLRWEDLDAGCFSGAGAGCGREFRRLRRSLGDSGECDPRAMVFAEDDAEEERMGWKADMDVDSSRQLSPVSVLDLHSDDDEESPLHSHCKLSHSHLLPFQLIQFPLRHRATSFYHGFASYYYHILLSFYPSMLVIISKIFFLYLLVCKCSLSSFRPKLLSLYIMIIGFVFFSIISKWQKLNNAY